MYGFGASRRSALPRRLPHESPASIRCAGSRRAARPGVGYDGSATRTGHADGRRRRGAASTWVGYGVGRSTHGGRPRRAGLASQRRPRDRHGYVTAAPGRSHPWTVSPTDKRLGCGEAASRRNAARSLRVVEGTDPAESPQARRRSTALAQTRYRSCHARAAAGSHVERRAPLPYRAHRRRRGRRRRLGRERGRRRGSRGGRAAHVRLRRRGDREARAAWTRTLRRARTGWPSGRSASRRTSRPRRSCSASPTSRRSTTRSSTSTWRWTTTRAAKIRGSGLWRFRRRRSAPDHALHALAVPSIDSAGMTLGLQEVFGIATEVNSASYVDRGGLDARLQYYLETQRHIAIHGDSKQGKTWLRSRLLEEARTIKVQCQVDTTPESLFIEALGQMDVRAEIRRVGQITAGGRA